MRESAVSAKLLFVFGLARNRRSPKRPSEPRPTGAHPEEDGVENGGAATVCIVLIELMRILLGCAVS